MKRLFLLVALAGLLTACQLERIETAYSLANAVATIDVNVVDINTGDTPADDFTVTASEGTVSGTTVTITGNPTVPEMDVTITVEYGGVQYPETVHVNSLFSGGTATYSVTILVGEIIVDGSYYIVVSRSEPDYQYEYRYQDGDNVIDYTYGGLINSWYLNETEFYLIVDVDFVVKTGSTVADLSIINQDYDVTINTIYDAYYSYKTVDVSTQFTISPYCYYNILVTYELAYYEYDVNLVDDSGSVVETIATFTKCTYSTAIESVEYDYSGHGHGHGSGYNSGGGIIISE